MADRMRECYRGCTLIVRRYRSTVRGKAWCNGQEIASLEGASEDDVMTSLHRVVDQAFTIETAPGTVAYPSASAYATALRANLDGLSAKYRSMLCAHYHAPDRTLDAQALAEAAAYPRSTVANLHYGKVGRLLGEALLFQPRGRQQGTPNWTLLLAETADESGPECEWRWRMRDEVAAALEAVGLVRRAN